MAKFTIQITCDNAAFDQEMENDGPVGEISRILEELAKKIAHNPSTINYGNLRDANGNTVGKYTYTE